MRVLNRRVTSSPSSPLVDGLNPAQRRAVLFGDGPLLIVAGAGSGKTTVLTRRIAHMVTERGVDPSSVLAITFTNKAATEMKERLSAVLGSRMSGMWVATFHSALLRILRRHSEMVGLRPGFTIYDPDDCLIPALAVCDRVRVAIGRLDFRSIWRTVWQQLLPGWSPYELIRPSRNSPAG